MELKYSSIPKQTKSIDFTSKAVPVDVVGCLSVGTDGNKTRSEEKDHG